MVYSLNYRRPARVSSRASLNGEEKQKSINESISSGTSSTSSGIPEALSFDRIISGGTCPPCTTRDFMNYLKYIEHAAENLQFFLWFHDYSKRFAQLPESERLLSPAWTQERSEAENSTCQLNKATNMSAEAAEIFQGTDFAGKTAAVGRDSSDPFNTPPRTPGGDSQHYGTSMESSDAPMTQDREAVIKKAEGVFQDAGVKWQPFTVQPYREEILRIITTYIADNSPRQLNLSSRERGALLLALRSTTHPSAFAGVMTTVEWSLRCQAHPNFVRWTICNGNRPRVVFARGLGIGGIVGGLVAAIVLCLSGASRAWRVLAFLGFFIGISTLIAAWKGMCVVLHGMHHRHLRPWELFVSEEAAELEDEKKLSMDSVSSSNSYEDEPWVAKYEKRNVVRKVFDREVWIQEPALRQIQDTIFVQALLGAFILSAVATGIFVALPAGHYF